MSVSFVNQALLLAVEGSRQSAGLSDSGWDRERGAGSWQNICVSLSLSSDRVSHLLQPHCVTLDGCLLHAHDDNDKRMAHQWHGQELTKQKETWRHCRPAETPTVALTAMIGDKEDLYRVGQGDQDWRHEVIGMRFLDVLHPAAAALHQGWPVSICDLDIVPFTTGVPRDLEVGELQPHHLSALHLDPLRLFESVGIGPRVVWGLNYACGITLGHIDLKWGIKILVESSCNSSPLLPQPSAGQSKGYIGFQTPLEEFSSGAHVRSTSHWPQQHLPERCPFPWSTRLSCLQSRAPGRAQGSPTVGATEREEHVPGKICL